MEKSNIHVLKGKNVEIELTQDLEANLILARLFGDIDGRFPLIHEEILKRLGDITTQIHLDMEKIRFVNSMGIKILISTLNKLKKYQIYFINTPPIFIDQCNLIIGLVKPNRAVKSLLVPYYDDELDDVITFKINVDEIVNGKAPERKSESGRILSFDRKEDFYFEFLSYQVDS